MKKVLIIAFYFPPLGGGGVQRPLKFVKYLREFGWEPIVLTVKPFRFKYANDYSLLKEIPSKIKILKAPYFNLSRFPLMGGTTGKFLYKPFEKKYLIPDKEIIWKYFAINKAIKIIKKENIDIIFSTIPPNSVSIIGEQIKSKTNIPWVCDIRDEWTSDQKRKKYFDSISSIRLAKEKELEFKTFNAANQLTIISEIAKKRIAEINKIPLEKINVIPNGFDSDDFVNNIVEYPKKGKKIRIAHPGNLSTRSFDSFLRALKNLEESGKLDPKTIQVDFITSSGSKKIKKNFNSEIINFCPYLEHKELLKELSSYHLLLLYIDPSETTMVTGKIFEYLYLKRNILAIVPPNGVAAEIVNKCNAGFVIPSDNIIEIENEILRIFALWNENNLTYDGIEDEIEKYDRKLLTRKLAKVLDQVVYKK